MPLPEIKFGTAQCDVPLGEDPGTLEVPPSVTLHLRDISEALYTSLLSQAVTELQGLGMVLGAMLTGVEEDGEPVDLWTEAECVEACTTWPFKQVSPIADAINELHGGPQASGTPLDFSENAAADLIKAVMNGLPGSGSPTEQD